MTQPETTLSDTAIAVHPNGERYKRQVGKHAKHPFLHRLLSIIAHDFTDKEFSTGAVKITSAHDPNDFAIGKRHSLAYVNILNDYSTSNQNIGKFQGHKRLDVRFSLT
jgi:valyl-tRNA synthetase